MPNLLDTMSSKKNRQLTMVFASVELDRFDIPHYYLSRLPIDLSLILRIFF